jgi:hypothetical protein
MDYLAENHGLTEQEIQRVEIGSRQQVPFMQYQ